MKRKIYMEVGLGLALKGVILKKMFIGYKVLYRDFDGKCKIIHFLSGDLLIPRD